MKFLRVIRSLPQTPPSAQPVFSNGKAAADYQNVMLRGYLSTFGNIDRDGDYVLPGAFADTIGPFLAKNPVLLCDHRNLVGNVAGTITAMREDHAGLYVEARLSNSPDQSMRHVRALVMERNLKTLSMGGVFYYAQDRHGIVKVDLQEASLVPIPSNPLATFDVMAGH